MCSSHGRCSLPACFAEQVYKGILRSTGESVAVKVQRPGIGDHIAVDMLLLRRLMAVIDKNQTIVSLWHGLRPCAGLMCFVQMLPWPVCVMQCPVPPFF